jgi:hypothetical protein
MMAKEKKYTYTATVTVVSPLKQRTSELRRVVQAEASYAVDMSTGKLTVSKFTEVK